MATPSRTGLSVCPSSVSADDISLRKQKLTADTPGSFPFLTHYPELMLDHWYWYKKFAPLYSLWLGKQLFVIISNPASPRIYLSPTAPLSPA